jgi:hypothetical protein
MLSRIDLHADVAESKDLLLVMGLSQKHGIYSANSAISAGSFNYTPINSTSSFMILVSSFFRAFISSMFSKYIIRLSL